MAKKKILVLTSTFPRWEGDSIPPFVLELCSQLLSTFEITVLAPHYPGARTHELVLGVEVIRYRYAPQRLERLAYGGGLFQNLSNNPLLIFLLPSLVIAQIVAIGRLLRREYDLVHAHWLVPQGMCAVLAKKIFRIRPPLVITIHGSDLNLLVNKTLHCLLKWLLNASSATTVVGKHQSEFLQRLGYEDKKVHVMPMGIDVRKIFSAVDIGSKKVNRIVFVGRLIEQKGAVIALHAVHQLMTSGRDVELVVIGDGPQRGELESLSASLKISNRVRFTGWLQKAGVADELRFAAIIVAPSLRPEGLGLVVIEGMASECAVVASDIPSFRYLLGDGNAGILVAPGDAAGVGAAILKLMDNGEIMQQMQVSARNSVIDHYDWPVVAGRYSQLFKELIGK